MSYMPVVIDAKYLQDYKLQIEFDNGEIKVFDCAHYLQGKIYEPLKDTDYFQKFIVDGWTVSWPNGADFSPEILYTKGEKVKT